MASISNTPTNSRSMNGIIILSDGVWNIEDGYIATEGNITTSNTITNYTNLNLGDRKTLSVYDDFNHKAYYTDIITLSEVVYNNYNTILSNANTIHNNAINNNLYRITLRTHIKFINNFIINLSGNLNYNYLTILNPQKTYQPINLMSNYLTVLIAQNTY